MKTSGCIDDQYAVGFLLRPLISGSGDLYGGGLSSERTYIETQALRIYFELFNSGGTIDVSGGKKNPAAGGLELSAHLCGSGCLTCTLQACHHDDSDLSRRFELHPDRLGAHHADQLLIYDLDNHLSRCQAVQNILTDRSLLCLPDELLHDLEVYIGL